MTDRLRNRARGPWRRGLFYAWIVLTIIVALYLAISAPLAGYFHEDFTVVAVVVPPLMILLLGLGIAWLATFVSAPGKTRDRRK